MLKKQLNRFKKSIVTKFEIVLVLSILIPLCIEGVLILKLTEKNIYDNTKKAIHKNLTLLSSNIDEVYSGMISIMNNYFNDERLQEKINKNYSQIGIIEKRDDYKDVLEQIIMPNVYSLKELNYTFIISEKDYEFTDFKEYDLINLSREELVESIKNKYITPYEWNYSVKFLGIEPKLFLQPMLVFAKSIKNLYGQNIGWVVLFVEESIFSDIYSEQGYNLEDSIMIADLDGNILSHVAKSKIGTNIKDIYSGNISNVHALIFSNDDHEFLLSSAPLFKGDLNLINIVPTSKLFKELLFIRTLTMITIFSIFILVIISSIVLVNRITAPLKKLKSNAIEVMNGNLNTQVDIISNDEIGELALCFDEMLKKIRNLINDIYNEQELKIQSEIKAYQAQINPHFLHNTLNNIKWLAISKGHKDIVNAISKLGMILESTMRNKTGMVKVSDELELLKNYIYLQKFRYRDKFEVNYNIDDSLYSYEIPNLLLQPILENCIFHGMGDDKFICIKIMGEIIENQLIIKIIDDGCGISEHVLKNIFNEKENGSSHIGLINVKRRIQLKFGEKYDIRVSSEEGKGTEVIINLPLIKEESK